MLINSKAILVYYTLDCEFFLQFFLNGCIISVKNKIKPIMRHIVGTVGTSIAIDIRCPTKQFSIPKETAMKRKDLRFLVIRFANDAGITIKPITIIAPTLSKLKTVEILDKPSNK